jgi:hypothetical protein
LSNGTALAPGGVEALETGAVDAGLVGEAQPPEHAFDQPGRELAHDCAGTSSSFSRSAFA